MLGGLGSQMFKYAFYLQIKETDECYIDTTPYYLQEMWNGYELERIFGIKERDLVSFFSAKELKELRKKEVHYQMAAGIAMEGITPGKPLLFILRGYLYPEETKKIIKFSTLSYNKVKRLCNRKNEVYDKYPLIHRTKLFSVYYDEFNHTSDKYLGGGRQKDKLRNMFQFPAFEDNRNVETARNMLNEESVSMHIRRSDHMYDNIRLFETGYFSKATECIKEHVQNPVFYLFSDEPEWCKCHLDMLGLQRGDKIRLVDWNLRAESFRDMQLMTYCKHNILAISSFGWWGYYLSCRNDKVVCAPEGYWLEVPIHF